ncbi:MAG: FkbM family methyltransferase [Porphyrobacter sp.]|nr:FkbM family methyltransferase [Porphyrobacter sp.]
MASFLHFRRKLNKGLALARVPVWRKGLASAVAAAIEHRDCLSDLDFSTCIDVGANAGQFSLLIRGIRPECRIFAFEPLARPAAKFREVHGGAPKVEFFNMALGAAAEEKVIQVTAKDDSSSFLDPADVRQFGPNTDRVGEEMVRIDRLDSVLSPEQLSGKVLLKMDVQGFEDKVLEGAKAILPHVEWVYTETSFTPLYAGQPLFDDLHTLLRDLGFEIRRIGEVSGTPSNIQSIIDVLYQRRAASPAGEAVIGAAA